MSVLPTTSTGQEDHVDKSDEDSVWYYDMFKTLQYKRMVFEKDYVIIRYNILERKKNGNPKSYAQRDSLLFHISISKHYNNTFIRNVYKMYYTFYR